MGVDDVGSDVAHDVTERAIEGPHGAHTERRERPALHAADVELTWTARDDDLAASGRESLREEADLDLHAAGPAVRDDQEHARRGRHLCIVARVSAATADSVVGLLTWPMRSDM
jgi:hypothetical protein